MSRPPASRPQSGAGGDGYRPPHVSLPPLRQFSRTPPTHASGRRGVNPLGVHSMLNSDAELVEQLRNQRGGSLMDSPSPIESLSLPSISRPSSVDSTVDSTRNEHRPTRSFQAPGRPQARHILSPPSPSRHVYRNEDLTIKAPTATINARQAPFLSANDRTYGPDPIAPQPVLPAPTLGQRAPYFHAGPPPPPGPTPPPHHNASRNEMRRPSLNFPQSGTASPMASYSPYSQAASIASSQLDMASQQGSFMGAASHPHSREYSNPPIAMETGHGGSERGNIINSSQSNVEMLRYVTNQGHEVQIPVEVQAASKASDEKRKRNAGASARFRARRKEKEREASMSINRLEQRHHDDQESIAHYRKDRDYFKSYSEELEKQLGQKHTHTRPPSPIPRHLSAALSVAHSSPRGGRSVSSYSAYDDAELDDEREPDRNVRRRTSSYHPASGPPPSQTNGSGQPPQAYPAHAFSLGNPQPSGLSHGPRQPHPTHQFDPREQRPLQDLQQAQSQRPVLRDPFASDPRRNENRNWGPEPHQEHRG